MSKRQNAQRSNTRKTRKASNQETVSEKSTEQLERSEKGVFLRIPESSRDRLNRILKKHKERNLNRSELFSILLKFFEQVGGEAQEEILTRKGGFYSLLSQIIRLQRDLQEADAAFDLRMFSRSIATYEAILRYIEEVPPDVGEALDWIKKLRDWIHYRIGSIFVFAADGRRLEEVRIKESEPDEFDARKCYGLVLRALRLSVKYSKSVNAISFPIGKYNIAVARTLEAQFTAEQTRLLRGATDERKEVRKEITEANKNGSPHKPALRYFEELKECDPALERVIERLWVDTKDQLETVYSVVKDSLSPTGLENRLNLHRSLDFMWFTEQLEKDPDLGFFRELPLSKGEFNSLLAQFRQLHHEVDWLRRVVDDSQIR